MIHPTRPNSWVFSADLKKKVRGMSFSTNFNKAYADFFHKGTSNGGPLSNSGAFRKLVEMGASYIQRRSGLDRMLSEAIASEILEGMWQTIANTGTTIEHPCAYFLKAAHNRAITELRKQHGMETVDYGEDDSRNGQRRKISAAAPVTTVDERIISSIPKETLIERLSKDTDALAVLKAYLEGRRYSTNGMTAAHGAEVWRRILSAALTLHAMQMGETRNQPAFPATHSATILTADGSQQQIHLGMVYGGKRRGFIRIENEITVVSPHIIRILTALLGSEVPVDRMQLAPGVNEATAKNLPTRINIQLPRQLKVVNVSPKDEPPKYVLDSEGNRIFPVTEILFGEGMFSFIHRYLRGPGGMIKLNDSDIRLLLAIEKHALNMPNRRVSTLVIARELGWKRESVSARLPPLDLLIAARTGLTIRHPAEGACMPQAPVMHQPEILPGEAVWGGVYLHLDGYVRVPGKPPTVLGQLEAAVARYIASSERATIGEIKARFGRGGYSAAYQLERKLGGLGFTCQYPGKVHGPPKPHT
jgi:DNA-directed RNA polymerase specialized sigma24 family protein